MLWLSISTVYAQVRLLQQRNQPSATGLAGGMAAVASSSTELAKLGKKGLAEGLRAEPGVSEDGDEELKPGDSAWGASASPGKVGILTGEEGEAEAGAFWADLPSLG